MFCLCSSTLSPEFFPLCLSPDNTGLGNVCLPQPGNSLRARLRPGSSALTSTENQDSLVPAAALLEVNATPHCPLSEISYREDAGKDGSSSLGLTTFPLAAIEATLGLGCPQVRGLTDPKATSFCVQTHVGIIGMSCGHNSWLGWGDLWDSLILSGSLPPLREGDHPPLPRVGLSPRKHPQGPLPDHILPFPPSARGISTQKRGSAPGHLSPERAPHHQPTAPPYKAFILGWDLRAGWLVLPQTPRAGRAPPTTSHQQTLLFIQHSRGQREPEKVQQRENPVQ